MDLNDIWQEHKAWILGVLAGVIVFFIADSMISSTYDLDTLRGRIRAAEAKIRAGSASASKARDTSKAQGRGFYGRQALTEARTERRELETAIAKAKERCYFRPSKDFLLEGKGDPSIHYLTLTSELKNKVRADADNQNVELGKADLGLPKSAPMDRDEIQRKLYGLDLLYDAVMRLFIASDRAVSEDIERLGLRAIDSASIDKRLGARRSGGGSRRKSKTGEADLGERVLVTMDFRADPVTIQLFLESLIAGKGADGKARRPLLLSSIRAQVGNEPEDPVTVKCEFLALIDSAKEEAE